MQKRYYYFLIVCILLLCAGAYFYYTAHANRLNQAVVQAVTVEAATVQEMEFPQQIEAVGTILTKERAKLSPEIAGVIAKFYALEGQHVKQGDPIIQLDDTILQTQATAIQAELKRDQQKYLRIAKLAQQGAIPKQDLDNALASLQTKQAELAVKQAELAKMIIRAPFDGVLGTRKDSVGEYVAVGEELIEIVNKRKVKVNYNIPEHFLPELKLGQQVNITMAAYPHQVFGGQIHFISPTIDLTSHTITLEADITNPQEELTPGMFVEVRHILKDKQKVRVIPEACLLQTIDGHLVYRIVNNKAVATPVSIGTRLNNQVEIIKGLQLAERVVLVGQQKLKDGSLVNIVKSPSL